MIFKNAMFSKMFSIRRARPTSITRKLFRSAITILPLLWSQLAFGSALSNLATSMQPGTWAAFATNGFNNGDIMRVACTGGSILQYMDKGGGWMSVDGTIIIEGGIHMGTHAPGCVGSSVVRYTESSNSWDRSIQQLFPNFDNAFPDPDGQGGGSIGHGYHHDAVVSAVGDMYHRQYNSGKVMKFSHSTQSWSQCRAIPGNQQVAGALEYFPDRNSLVWLDGDWGVWELSLASGNCTSASWVQRASTIGGGFSPQLTGMFSYSNQSRYSSRCACVVLGGGGSSNTLYRYNSNGTFSNVTSTGAPPSIKIPGDNSGTVFTVDPVTGYILAWSNFDARTTIYQYDPLNNVWTSISNTSPFFPTAEGQNTNAIAIPIETYGVIMLAFGKCPKDSV